VDTEGSHADAVHVGHVVDSEEDNMDSVGLDAEVVEGGSKVSMDEVGNRRKVVVVGSMVRLDIHKVNMEKADIEENMENMEEDKVLLQAVNVDHRVLKVAAVQFVADEEDEQDNVVEGMQDKGDFEVAMEEQKLVV
jgi:hypothetical protein